MRPRLADRVRGLRRTLIREIFESAPPDALNLGLGQPDLDPPPALREALARAAADGPAGYGPTAGDRELRRLVAEEYGGFVPGPEHVVITVGCQQATFVVLGCLLDPGDEVLVPDPGFPGAERAARAWGAIPRAYPLRPENGFHLDPDEVLALVGPRTRAIVVISPSNPTGTVEPAASLERVREGAHRAGVVLVLDDTYRHLHWLGDGPAPGPPSRPDPLVVTCGGLSKSASLTGWRVGWALVPDPDLLAKVVALQQTVLTCAATPVQLAAREAFSPAGRAGMAEIRATFRRRRDLVERVLGDVAPRAPLEGAFYAFVDASRQGGGRAFARRLLEEDGIVVIPGEAFGRTCPGWVRVGYAREDDALARAFARIRDRLSGRG